MKFLITMHMPSATGYLVHQVTVDHKSNSCAEFCEALSTEIFIICRQFYKRKTLTGEPVWEDRGDVILNTTHIGKVQEYIISEKEHTNDEPYGYIDNRRVSPSGTRGPVRPR